jgi:uncharacterized membrane protein YedE/YeeE
MNIDWQSFDPWNALVGGMLIGLTAALMIVFLGRIAGISGIIGRLLQSDIWGRPSEWSWRAVFILGMLTAPLVWKMVGTLPVIHVTSNSVIIVIAGLLVGFGTRLGSGCTSGHGVCGLSRLSFRSLVATITFLLTGMLTVYVMRHILRLT